MEKMNLFGDVGEKIVEKLNLFDDKEPEPVHYKGALGVFDYNPDMFEIRYGLGNKFSPDARVEHLHYRGKTLNISLPKGCINTNYMFLECKLPEGATLSDDFNTKEVKNMRGMFFDAELPEGFSLGSNFDTCNVKDMTCMFYNCVLPEGFNLGNFDTSKVKYMDNMFMYCKLPEGFTLGDKFDTSNVKDMCSMFYCTELSKDSH